MNSVVLKLLNIFTIVVRLHSCNRLENCSGRVWRFTVLLFWLEAYEMCWSQWPRGLRHRSTAARPLRLCVRIPPGAWMFVCCECCVLSGRGLCDGLITRPEESYRLWRFVVCDHETSRMRRLKPATGLWKIQPKGCNAKKNNKHMKCKSHLSSSFELLITVWFFHEVPKSNLVLFGSVIVGKKSLEKTISSSFS